MNAKQTPRREETDASILLKAIQLQRPNLRFFGFGDKGWGVRGWGLDHEGSDLPSYSISRTFGGFEFRGEPIARLWRLWYL